MNPDAYLMKTTWLLLREAERALAGLCDRDAAYFGNEIRLTCDNHTDALKRMIFARAALAAIREAKP